MSIGSLALIAGCISQTDRAHHKQEMDEPPDSARHLAVSPDGKRVAFEYLHEVGGEKVHEVWIAEIHGPGTMRLPTPELPGPARALDPYWHPNSGAVLYGVLSEQRCGIAQTTVDESMDCSWIVETPGVVPERLSISPDGRWLLYHGIVLAQQSQAHLAVVNLQRKDRRAIITEVFSNPRRTGAMWHPLRSAVYFVDRSAEVPTLRQVNVTDDGSRGFKSSLPQ